MPKILLFALNSSYMHTNLGVRCIKKELIRQGHDAYIAEFNLKDKRRRVLEALVFADADIYGFSAYIWNIRELLLFAEELKWLRPKAKLILGGPEVSYNAEELLTAHPFIDCIIKGEGESAFCRAAEMVENGEELPPIMDGGVFEEFPEQGMVYDRRELDGGRRIVYYESSRGCPYRCAYCLSALSGHVRAKSADVTLAELLSFEAVENIKIIKFVDRTFNFDKERAKAVWRGLLSEQYTKNYHFEICADLLDEESFEILRSFPKGKIQLEIGVQSTNPDTLKRIDRSPNTEKLLQNIARLYSFENIHIHADLIAGLPGEDLRSFARSFDALYGKCHMLQLGFLKLLHGSALRRVADSFGCVYSPKPPYEVLSTDALSFGELCMLHDIDDINDRFSSGAFTRAMVYIMEDEASPFSLLRGFADMLRSEGVRVSELSQPRAYEALYRYGARFKDGTMLAEYLTLDYLTSQNTSPPRFGEYEMKRGDDAAKRRFAAFADAHGIEYFAPALEVRVGEREYVIDRRFMHAYASADDGFEEI